MRRKLILSDVSSAEPESARQFPLFRWSRLVAADFWAMLLICAVVGLVFIQVADHRFVAWDDTSYVSENPRVLQGLNLGNLIWAFSTFQLSNWHPLTLLSHMLDVSLWGLRPGAHALTSAGLHLANTLLTFLLFRKLFHLSAASDSFESSGRGNGRWPALFIALAFAVHPLHVESVAWISERKDVLCAFFWLLALHAYLGYTQKPSLRNYLVVSFCVVLALLAKPMAVTLPLVMLLLDRWPLQRARTWSADAYPRLAVEKLPWLAMSAISAAMTWFAQTQAMPPFDLLERVQIGVVAYGWYLEKTLWPTGLHFYYLTEGAWSALRLTISAVALLGISVLVWTRRQSQPAWLVGWLCFLLTLLPVVGFVKVGTQAWADRYTYLPHLGLFWMLASMLGHFSATPIRRRAIAVAAVFVLVVLTGVASRQVAVWRNTTSLYQNALHHEPSHYVAIMGLAGEALRQKDYRQARQLAEQAMILSQGHALVRAMRGVLGDVAMAGGDWDAAIRHYVLGRAADPVDEGIRTKLGLALIKADQPAAAELEFRAALNLQGDSVDALNGLGVAVGLQGRLVESAAVLQRGLKLAPTHRGLLHNLAATALRAGDRSTARATYLTLTRLYPADDLARQAISSLPE